MDIKQLMEKHTNDEGAVDYDAMNRDIEQTNQEAIKNEVTTQVGAIKSKAKKKQAQPQAQETTEQSNESADNNALMKQIQEMQQELQNLKNDSTTQKQSSFLKKGKDLGVDEAVLNTFVNSGADLNQIDLDALAPKTKAKAPQTEQTEQNDTKEVSDEAKRSDLAQQILKKM